MYFVYVLKMGNGQLYVGYTNDLKRRLVQHKAGESFSTKKYLPVELVYCEVYKSKLDAMERERKLKQHKKGFAQLRNRIKRSLN